MVPVPERDPPVISISAGQGGGKPVEPRDAPNGRNPAGFTCKTGLEGLELPALGDADAVWQGVLKDAREIASSEPVLRSMVERTVLQQATLEDALATCLASRLGLSDGCSLGVDDWRQLLADAFHRGVDTQGRQLGASMRMDLQVIQRRDPACQGLGYALLYFKGFQSLQAYRAANVYWHQGRRALALEIQSAVSMAFGLDIHPAANVGHGVLLDHGTGVVVGETAVIGDFCTILHGVTLGGSGKEVGDRHPKLGRNVLVGAGVSILGNIRIGCCSKIGAGSVVLQAIPMGATAVGVPARVVGRAQEKDPAESMDQTLQQVKLCKAFKNFRSIWDTVAVMQQRLVAMQGVDRSSFDSNIGADTDRAGEFERLGGQDTAAAMQQPAVAARGVEMSRRSDRSASVDMEPAGEVERVGGAEAVSRTKSGGKKSSKCLWPSQVYETLKHLRLETGDMDNLIFYLDKDGDGHVSSQDLQAAVAKFVVQTAGDRAQLSLPPMSPQLEEDQAMVSLDSSS